MAFAGSQAWSSPWAAYAWIDNGSVSHRTSAWIRPSRRSAAMRAASWPVGARNTDTVTPGLAALKPSTTASTVAWVTDV